jgi:ketosteroid isomerase-like protein
MIRRVFFLAAILLPTAPAAAAATPVAILMVPINAMIAATNADNMAGIDAYYTPDAVIVDEFAPYRWTGQAAATQWWNGVRKMSVTSGTANVHATVQRLKYYQVAGDDAYAVVPLHITYTLKSQSAYEDGILTLTLRRGGGIWRIATQVFTTATSPDSTGS